MMKSCKCRRVGVGERVILGSSESDLRQENQEQDSHSVTFDLLSTPQSLEMVSSSAGGKDNACNNR